MTNLQSTTYWILFVGAFLAVAVWESFLPKRVLSVPAERRWGRHVLLLAASDLFVKLAAAVASVMIMVSVVPL